MKRVLILLSVILFAINSMALQVVPDSFAELVKKVSPAVVNISTVQKVNNKRQIGSLFPQGSPFEDFNELFERFGLLPPAFEEDQDRTVSSLGSGFIIDPKGYIVTNHHVIENADEIMVNLSNETKYNARLVGSDPKTDIALLKIKAKENLPFIALADSDKSQVGDWIIAIGNPFGLGGTVTAGIISAKARDIQAGSFDDFIQTDAAVNSGNSGGPMINMSGEVIGINTAIVSTTGGSVGIGFAIPSTMAKPIVEQIKTAGKVVRGWIGVTIHPVTPEIAKSVGLKEAKGAIITDVIVDAPGHKAGLKAGDIVLEFNDKKIKSSRDLPRVVANAPINKKSFIKIFREGKEVKLDIIITETQDDAKLKLASASGETKIQKKLGVSLLELNNKVKQDLRINSKVNGILIRDVDRKGKAAKQGLRKGDIIMKINGKEITTIRQFEETINEAFKHNKPNLLVYILRQNNPYYIGLDLKLNK
jgi:serine protease Do